jgi:hypothetical protein
VIAGHAFVRNVRRGCYELAIEEPKAAQRWSNLGEQGDLGVQVLVALVQARSVTRCRCSPAASREWQRTFVPFRLGPSALGAAAPAS